MKGREEMKKIADCAILVLAVGCVIAASSVESFAQTDPYPNSVGIYFDEDAFGNTANVVPPAVAVAYLIATRYDGLGGVDAWRGGVSCEVPVEATIRGGGVNAFSNGPDFFLHFDVSLATPLPLSSSIVLAELSVDITTEAPIKMYLESSVEGDGLVCSSGGDERHLQPSVPCYSLPCYPAWVASINLNGPVMSDTINWGEIKSLYR